MKKLLCLLLILGATLALVGCSPESINYDFKFNTPEGFDSLSAEDQLAWGEKNGYFTVKETDGEYELGNPELLDAFLEESDEEKELLIMTCIRYSDGEKTNITGIYYDGSYYYYDLPGGNVDAPDNSLYRYEICGVEQYRDRRILRLSNDSSLTYADELAGFTSSSAEHYEEFRRSYCPIVYIGRDSN